MSTIAARSLPGLPEIALADDLGRLIAHAARHAGLQLDDETVVVVAHKAVSKSEGAVVDLQDVRPGPRALELTARLGRKDARAVQVVLDQSSEVVRADHGVLICRTQHGFVCANAGVDASNALSGTLVVLPHDPDASARALRARLLEITGARPAIVITDTFGRAWRRGQCDVAIGCAGLSVIDDWRGRIDGVGRGLHATMLAVADAAAAAADLARAKDSREPVVLVSGLERYVSDADGPGAVALVRAEAEDLFR